MSVMLYFDITLVLHDSCIHDSYSLFLIRQLTYFKYSERTNTVKCKLLYSFLQYLADELRQS